MQLERLTGEVWGLIHKLDNRKNKVREYTMMSGTCPLPSFASLYGDCEELVKILVTRCKKINDESDGK